MKVVVNKSDHPFRLSSEAIELLSKAFESERGKDIVLHRNDPRLVSVVDKLGASAGDGCALTVDDIDGDDYLIVFNGFYEKAVGFYYI